MINNITKKLENAEKQIIANMSEVENAEHEIKKAGFDLKAMKADGFKYDSELETSPVKQAEQFCEHIICAMNDY
ncbi:MAG: hypothetical protein PHY21_09785 [Candidatus Cloacimonetes bacterium]|nr:hypothetical protein [Candidatus Cloacimonadota bacterium]